ncbi:hypothetical protein [Pedobacter duraquae]|nr:hypothetical protein [Pedobacter duraquae]
MKVNQNKKYKAMNLQVTDRQSFMKVFQTEFNLSIENIEEDYNEKLQSHSYNVQLKNGIDKSEFENRTIRFINSNNKFDESFDIWVNGYGEEIGTSSYCIAINADYDSTYNRDGSENNFGELELEEPYETFNVEIDGKPTHHIVKFLEDDQPVEYVIYVGEEYIGAISPVHDEAGNLRWKGNASLDPLVVKKITNHIQSANL